MKQLFHRRHNDIDIQKVQFSRKNAAAHTIARIADQTSRLPKDSERIPAEFSENERTEMIQSEKLASLGTLTNGLVHELNNPLAIISGHQYRLMTLTSKIETGSDEIQKSLNKIDQAIKRVMSVIDALKVYSQDDRSSPEFSSINIRETVQYTLDLCRERLKSLGMTLTTQPIPDTLIEGHQGQIMQVLLALIENAIDALVDYDKEKMISIDYRQSVTMIEISVIDSGPGIPQHLHSKIFDPFFTGKSDDRHRGLGLSVASGIIAKHDGRLFLDHDFPSTRFVLQLRR
jgi:C4-dicarboxylate-specific signal transduction histidine kinase